MASSETVTFSEFTNALSNPVVLGIINFAPMAGDIILELSTNIGFAILDRMLGGAGKPLEKNRSSQRLNCQYLTRLWSPVCSYCGNHGKM